MKKVAIVSTGHPPFDERIFDKVGNSLIKFGYDVHILVTTEKIATEKNNIKILGDNFTNLYTNPFTKFKFILKNLRDKNPDLIICCEPIPVLFSFFSH